MDILIVDDSKLIVSKITELLDDLEMATSLKSCGTYAHAVCLIDSSRPFVALLDINLPDKSGIELLQHVKMYSPETTVIMFTNQSSDYYKKLCFKMGADHFLDKSKDFDNIRHILASLS
ncbi:response regulator [Segetibacter aerophilus]|uniref:Response regulatory domain-containing protein n=1 Tax=Segetibacter aerophilus TaxID=670293 RepID=A0A512BGT7_9BACT|nr:response regulator [Segetibacter aerophilus]GEO11179.1 hypothetical protein SAE01_36750 [Segetibacter aerophilus]